MVDEELGGNIILSGFDLDNQEKIIVKKMSGKYVEKIRNLAEYDELKLVMKSHLENKTKKYEVKGLVIFGGNKAESEAQGFNVFVLIDEVMQKIINEIERKVKK